jgi:cysteine synthase
MLSPERESLYSALMEKVGNTPLYQVSRIPIPNNNRIFAKEERLNPTGSTFDRLYPYLFYIFESEGKIVPGVTPVIEVSTGNAGASFAWCAAQLGYYDCTVIIHEDAPKARVEQIRSYGAKVIFSPSGQYAKGYVKLLEHILIEEKRRKGKKYGQGPEMMFCVTKIDPRGTSVYKKLVDEVRSELNGEQVDYYITAVGSGTSSTGIARYLKEWNKHTVVIAVDPEECPSTYHLKWKHRPIELVSLPHDVFGAASFGLPLSKLNIDLSVIDAVATVSREERERTHKMLIEVEQKPVGRPSALVMAYALKLSQEVENKNILICFSDPLWKYEDSYPYLK